MTLAFAPTTPTPTPADPTQEYVAGGQYPYAGFTQYARALPHPGDDLQRSVRPDIYEQMELDAHVRAVTTIYRASIVGDGLETVPVVDETSKKPLALAKQIAGECDEMMETLDTPVDELLYTYTRAMTLGNMIGELVWELRGGKLVVKDIKIKPRQATMFVVDPFMNVLGLLAIIPGSADWLSLIPPLVGTTDIPNLLPREKFAIFTWHPEFNDPRGTSNLRSVYTPWWNKVQLQAEYLKYMTQFASPSVIAELAPDARDVPVLDVKGNATFDTNGRPMKTSVTQAMAQSVMTLRNGGFIVIPNGAKVTALTTPGDGKAFDVAFHTYNRDIVLGVLTQTLATGEGEHASRAQAGVHQDALQTIVKQGKQGLCGMVQRDIYRQYVLYNYGPQALPLTPEASLGDASEVDYGPRWTALAALMSSTYLDPSQLAALDVENGLPPRSEDSVKLAVQMQQQAAQLAMNPPPPQPGQAGQQRGQGGPNAKTE